jgi:hypothetical protein
MTGIGISLEDLGIETDAAFTRPETQEDEGFPKEYDFALDLLIHNGSWRQMRDALYPVAEAAFRGRETPLLGLTLHWAGRDDGDTEESIKAALTGLRYDQEFHEALEENLADWARFTDDAALLKRVMSLVAGTDREWIRYEPLGNSWLDPQDVRAIFELIKDDRRGPQALAESKAPIPADIVEWLAKRDYADSYIPYRLVSDHAMTEQTLLDLIGKCDAECILRSPACTDRVRDEINRVRASGGALTSEQRSRVSKDLKRIQSAIKSGRTGAIERRRGWELQLLHTVRDNPEIMLGEVHEILSQDDF